MAHQFFIVYENNTMRFPVTPEKYLITHSKSIKSVNTTKNGDVYLAGQKLPLNVSIEGFFTTNDYDFALSPTISISKTLDYITFLKDIQDKSGIVRFIISNGVDTIINERFLISDFTFSEDSTTNGDIKFSIDLKEYRELSANTVTASTTSTGTRPVDRASTNRTHTVLPGESLSRIARKYYGKDDWQKIYNANKDVIGKNPNIIYAGQVLKIPQVMI